MAKKVYVMLPPILVPFFYTILNICKYYLAKHKSYNKEQCLILLFNNVPKLILKLTIYSIHEESEFPQYFSPLFVSIKNKSEPSITTKKLLYFIKVYHLI